MISSSGEVMCGGRGAGGETSSSGDEEVRAGVATTWERATRSARLGDTLSSLLMRRLLHAWAAFAVLLSGRWRASRDKSSRLRLVVVGRRRGRLHRQTDSVRAREHRVYSVA